MPSSEQQSIPTTQQKNKPGDIAITTSIEISAARDNVFNFWRNLENFPKFMSHVKEVRATANNRYAWRVSGPLGVSMQWEADVTHTEPHKHIAWQSIPGSEVANSGVVRFEPSANGGTTLFVQMNYTPPLGQLGHALASLLGIDPKKQMDDDLRRCKELLETGSTQVDGKTISESTARETTPETHRVH